MHDLETKIQVLERVLEGARYSYRANTQQHSEVLRIKASRRERASLYKCITTSWGCICKDAHLVNLSLFPGAGNSGLNLLFLSQPDELESPNTQAQLPWSWKLVAVQSMVTAPNNLQDISQESLKNTT